MKFASLNRLFDRRPADGPTSRGKRRRRRSSGEVRQVTPFLERLEERSVPSVVPAPIVGSRVSIDQPGPDAPVTNDSTPSVAIDPTNPNNLAAVWTTNIPAASGDQKIFTEGAASSDGGKTWNNFSIPTNLFDPTRTTSPPFLFTQATDAGVAFDRSGNFYVVQVEHNADLSAGALVLEKYSFGGGSPSRTITDNVLYQWAGGAATSADRVIHTNIAVDNNLASFTDPTTGKTVTDKFAGTVYVAWSTINEAPGGIPNGPPPPNFNPNVIKMMASGDGGNTFSTPIIVNDGNNFSSNFSAAGEHDTTPTLVISQGTADGRISPGQLTIAWDDFGTGAGAAVPFDRLVTDTVQNGGSGAVFTGLGGAITDAVQGTPSDMPSTSTFDLPVSITDPNFVVTDLNVTLNITNAPGKSLALGDYEIQLVAPDNTTATLLLNHQLSDGTQVTGRGTTGNTFGILNGHNLGATFDDQTGVPINDKAAVAPYANAYRPEVPGGLTQFNGRGPTGVNGVWRLEITDNKNSNIGQLVNWQLHFTSGLSTRGNVVASNSLVRGADTLQATPLKPAVAPNIGIGPNPVLASDNTLGSFSPFQGDLYLAYVGHRRVPNPISGTGDINPADNTDIYVRVSTDGGNTWSGQIQVNDDFSPSDGFSEAGFLGPPGGPITYAGGRPQFDPSVAVDQSTGAVVVSFYDARLDAARARPAMFVGVSIDGGQTYAPEVFVNAAQTATDAITGSKVTLEPIPDNQSAGDANVDTAFGFGIHQGLVVANGVIHPVWASNQNSNLDATKRMGIRTAQATYAVGPRIISGTMGPVASQTVDGKTFNNTFTADGIQQITGFTVTFDRPVDPGTFGPGDVQVQYRAPNVNPSTPGTPVGVANVVPLDAGAFGPAGAQGATTFFIQLTSPQSATGTYSYAVGPNINDRVRFISGGATVSGHAMDQNANGVAGENPGDVFSIPRPLGGTPFVLPYDSNTLPIIEPGPHIVSTTVQNASVTDPLLVLNGTASFIDVVFDRDMTASTFTPDKVLRIMGPAGLINGPFTVTPNPNHTDPNPNFPRTFRIGFPTQQLSGTYTISLSPSIAAENGDLLDTNLNAGLDNLRGIGNQFANVGFSSSNVPVTISPGATVTSTLTVSDNFQVSAPGPIVGLNITYPNDPDLEAQLIAPDGTTIQLFTNPGNPNGQNFTNTFLSDAATTPIQTPGLNAPFQGNFNPQQPLSQLDGKQAGGTYTLVIKNDSPSRSGTLTGWSLLFRKPLPGTGLGEPVADIATASFRIFTMDPTNPLSHDVWTAVGPASNNGGGNSGRIGGLAIDPSDLSGNTVYVAGASGGVWKTTNFLTTDPNGPTYIPLTDFGPSFGANIGGLAVFGRNTDPNQSVVFAATGEGDTAPVGGNQFGVGRTGIGVGFLRSMDGGATWTVLDSTVNVDGNGNTLPIDSPLRDHKFVGSSAFKVIVDPQPTLGGGVIAYAAITGPAGGIWRTMDSGNHWQLMRAGNATDVVLAVDSATAQSQNLQIVYAGFRGEGVFLSPNQGATWQLMAGGVGNPLIQDFDPGPPTPPVPVNGPSSVPQSNGGRIVLAAPSVLTGNPIEDKQFEGWLYAVVVTAGNHLGGLYLTKDFGQNWVSIQIPEALSTVDSPPSVGTPSNDTNKPDADPLGNQVFAQGNYDVSLAMDPTNPNIVYIGGTDDGAPNPQGGLIRVDTTGVYDAHALIGFDNHDPGAGSVQQQTNGGVVVKDPTKAFGLAPFGSQQFLNLTRNPGSPFLSNATVELTNVKNFTNTGAGIAKWTDFNAVLGGSTDQHRVITMIDPVTGHARLIFGDDQGVWSGVDFGNGTLITGVGTAALPTGSRNGNLQITQFYYGAVQPSNLAADIAGALFYGQAQDNGNPVSDPALLSNGNLNWFGSTGDGQGVATDQTGSGTAYHFNWPCCGGGESGLSATDFFTVSLPGTDPTTGISRTFGLIQQSNPGQVPDPQWPFLEGFNFGVNPVNRNQIVVASAAGRIFRTEDEGVTWFVIADPADVDGAPKGALTFGAPDPNGTGNLDDFIYAGSTAGKIFVTFTGGGANGNQWLDISNGLDGSPVMQIVADPVRGSHDAFAVTQKGVYFIRDSSGPAASWTNITGNLFGIQRQVFGNSALASPELQYLTTIVADWRVRLPNNPFIPDGATHPVLYVGGQGGVFRSTDQGTTWTVFPNVAQDGAPVDGGYFPNAEVSHLELAVGNIDPTSGLPDQATGPDLLVASTYGRGTFAIHLPANLVSGPRVVGVSPSALPPGSTIDHVTVTFADTVDPSTFTVGDITTFVGPLGPITPTAVKDVDPTTHKVYEIDFPAQTAQGTYTFTFGPAIFDFSGDAMDQNGNGVNGEPNDNFTGHFTIGPIVPPLLVTGPDAGGGPEVKVIDPTTNKTSFDFYAYDSHFQGGVRVALADINSDGLPDIITGPGPGGGPDVRVFDGNTGAMIREFYAYDSNFQGGVYVAVGDVNGDGVSDIVTGADAGGGPHVKVFDGKALAAGTISVLYSFFAYTSAFHGGVRVAAADVNGDGFADIITAAGPGGGPHVEAFSGKDGSLLMSFYAYDSNFHSGVYVAARDVSGDGHADIITGAGAGGGPHVKVFSGSDGSVLQSFYAYAPGFTGGVRVTAIGDFNGDGNSDIATSPGPSGGPHVEIFDGITAKLLDSFYAYDSHFTGGVFVGAQ